MGVLPGLGVVRSLLPMIGVLLWEPTLRGAAAEALVAAPQLAP